MTSSWKLVLAGALAIVPGFSGSAAIGQGGNGGALQAKYASVRPALAQSQFQRPLLLESSPSPAQPRGDVYAIIDHPFSVAAPALAKAEHWCDVLILQLNIKRCVPAGEPSRALLQVALGPKAETTAPDGQQIEFRFAVVATQPGYLAVRMDSPSGPLGTSDYRLALEAVPLDARRSFVHLSYSYANGVAARVATSAYLASAGRNKIGFSIVGTDASGQPVYVGGMQGVVERNTMRYFLAIDAFLQSLALPSERQFEQRLRDWFAATERYARQLREMSLDDYLASKRRGVRG